MLELKVGISSVAEPEPIFLLVGAGAAFLRRLWLRLHLLGKQKKSLVLVSNITLRAV